MFWVFHRLWIYFVWSDWSEAGDGDWGVILLVDGCTWEWPLPASDLNRPRTEDGSEFVLQRDSLWENSSSHI